MLSPFRRFSLKFAWLLLLVPLLVPAEEASNGAPLSLFSRSPQVDDLPVLTVTPVQQKWLQQKKTLRLGVSAAADPPFAIINDQYEYEGISADYAGMLQAMTGVPVEILRFNTRREAYAAMNAGRIDMMATATTFEASRFSSLLTTPYGSEQTVLVHRIGDRSPVDSDLSGKKVAMAEDYLPVDLVRQRYPHAEIVLYPSYREAIGAVSFAKADLYLGDLYPIGKNYLNNLRVLRSADFPDKTLSFAVSKNNGLLLSILNQALAQIPSEERLNTMQRWHSGRSSLLLSQQPLPLTPAEQQWISEHPTVRVMVNSGFAPLTLVDEDGNFRGITSDILAQTQVRTGLHFEIVEGGSVEEMIDSVREGDAEMIGAMTPSDPRRKQLLFSRAYYTSGFVLVVPQKISQPISLADLAGKRLAVIAGSQPAEYIRRDYPHIQLVPANDAEDVLALLDQGEADAAVNTLTNSAYQLTRYYHGRMRIAATVGANPAFITFAVAQKDPELKAILDKVILSMPPDELDAISNRWRPPNMVIADNFWRQHREAIIASAGFALLLVLLSFGWGIYLRYQMRLKSRAQQALADQYELVSQMLDGTPFPMYIRDLAGRLTNCNDSYIAKTGASKAQALGSTVIEEQARRQPEEAALYHQQALNVMKTGTALFEDHSFTLPDGQQVTVWQWLVPYRNAAGKITGAIGGWLDISDRRMLMEALSEAKEQAEAANRAKSTFLSTMSHEIRTPLNAVIGMLEMAIKDSDRRQVNRETLEVAYESANGLVDLIGDILDIARIESGKLELAPERCQLRSLTDSVMRMFDGVARQKRLTLTLDYQGSEDDLLIDPLRFKQVLANLIGNALKFTRQGGVTVSLITQSNLSAQQTSVQLRIKDSGVGISKQDQARLFTSFSQAENQQGLSRQGSGLGLVISRSLCEMMGGRLTLCSEPGVGTEVIASFTLPLLAPEDAAKSLPQIAFTAMPDSALPLTILVVDDYRANRLLLIRQLTWLGHQVTEAAGGEEGLALWLQGEFDVVITDCNMPGVNGYQLAQAIRQQEQQQQRQACLLLAYTANAQPDEKARCLAAGMDGCLFKPGSLNDLALWLAGREPAAKSAAENDLLNNIHYLTLGDKTTTIQVLEELARSTSQDHQNLVRLSRQSVEPDRPNEALNDEQQNRDADAEVLNIGAIAELAHGIKDSAALVKAEKVTAACNAVESACKQGVSQEDVQGVIAVLAAEMLLLQADIEQALSAIKEDQKNAIT